jgi:DNA-binding transcriptional MocR family regulator
MLESPGYRVLTRSAHQVMSRIEIELRHHGGRDNGKLPVTFEDFIEYGLDRQAIAPAIRELEALGFIEVTERGRGGHDEPRAPTKFRLSSVGLRHVSVS